MPLFDMKCPQVPCGHKWEVLIVNTGDDRYFICPKCGQQGEKEISRGTDFIMKAGFAARNSYGLRRFDDGGSR